MPFTSGTAETPTVLLNALNTHLVANSWTKLRGETDMSTDSPVTTRYWRVLIVETQGTTSDFRSFSRIELKTTPSGANVATNPANWSTSASFGTGDDISELIDGSTATVATSIDINDDNFWLKYDFGSGTIVREVLLACSAITNNAPQDFYIQWSNDDVTWTTMRRVFGEVWTTSEVKVFTFADTYRDAQHYATDNPRRSGASEDVTGGDQESEDVWMWQGPGYDAARRVYFGMRSYYNLATLSSWIEMTAFTGYSAAVLGVGTGQEGASLSTVKHVLNVNPVEYWIYSNSLRVILITKSGINNYHSTYIGFLAAFALPDEYPFPLLISSTQESFANEGTINSAISSMVDPGVGARVRLWDNTWKQVEGRNLSDEDDLYRQSPSAWTWPYSPGSTAGGSWPGNVTGSSAGGGVHWMDQVVSTEQGELPLIPVVVMEFEFGNLGAMDGVYAVPSGGELAPQQVITIAAQDYRIFPNIHRRGGNDFFAVRED